MTPKGKGRRIAVLGDIAEIEGYEEQTYRKIARAVLEADVELLITYGTDSRQICDSLDEAKPDRRHFSEQDALLSYMKKSFRGGDVILFKASGSMHMDQIVNRAYPVTFFLAKLPYRRKTLRWSLQTI